MIGNRREEWFILTEKARRPVRIEWHLWGDKSQVIPGIKPSLLRLKAIALPLAIPPQPSLIEIFCRFPAQNPTSLHNQSFYFDQTESLKITATLCGKKINLTIAVSANKHIFPSCCFLKKTKIVFDSFTILSTLKCFICFVFFKLKGLKSYITCSILNLLLRFCSLGWKFIFSEA